MSILLLVTGGTLDKNYQEISGELTFTETHLKEMLHQARSALSIELKTLMLKDSLEMTDSDREQILKACTSSQSSQIVITHGTDTMTETATYLKSNLQPIDKTVVLTGAMRPFKLGDSDALFNLGCALMAVQTTNSGIYITMNGHLFEAENVKKNKTLGVFNEFG